MARLAADALVDMYVVLEVDKIRQVVDARPLQGGIISEARPHRLENSCLGPDLGMTAHAGFRRWDTGKRCFLHRRVAEAAVDTHAGYVMLVAEGRRLVFGHAHVIDVVDPIDVEENGQQHSDDNDRNNNGQVGKPIDAPAEYLRRHELFF